MFQTNSINNYVTFTVLRSTVYGKLFSEYQIRNGKIIWIGIAFIVMHNWLISMELIFPFQKIYKIHRRNDQNWN